MLINGSFRGRRIRNNQIEIIKIIQSPIHNYPRLRHCGSAHWPCLQYKYLCNVTIEGIRLPMALTYSLRIVSFYDHKLPDFRFSRSGTTSDLVRLTRNDLRRMERRKDSGIRENFVVSGLRSGRKKFLTANIVIVMLVFLQNWLCLHSQ